MTTDPRTALTQLTEALEEHLNAVASRRGDQDPAVDAAYLGIADAFEVYEDALYVTYDEVTPLEVFVEDDDEDEEDDDEDFDEEDLEDDDDEDPEGELD
ncbi:MULTISPECIES: hypothetical protein [Rothia]|uniref:Primosomal protein n=1 Tax=Rothia kristinae TaxID=37923 RepID=A0A147E896_9MICC|nr:hypothetical protein [Rothia kristinae]TDP57060.1 hypothetical protein DEU33_0648 [Kocuria sp. AG109]SIM89718.1 Uncharacterised protein [Mycobacteroides abscessus subsp. abscessus]KTR37237.1 hypothetical protein RSA5_08695 [Rothia kristinae]KTR52201.1 hypothetical protein SA11R_09660 [Rothia kristinae]KTR67363.1 hypothetical protein SA12R_06405 [Rothia kristinae]